MQAQDTTYLPQPPQSIEAGPTGPAPGASQFWVSGHWQWRGDRYVWMPGYWTAYQSDWIYVPATYAWTPRGWVYVPGYWDYPLARRGLVFSPVYLCPAGPLLPAGDLPGCGRVRRLAFLPPGLWLLLLRRLLRRPLRREFWHSSLVLLQFVRKVGYDPLFGYYNWYHVDHMGEREWGVHLVGWHDYYRGHPDMRPPRTWAA